MPDILTPNPPAPAPASDLPPTVAAPPPDGPPGSTPPAPMPSAPPAVGASSPQVSQAPPPAAGPSPQQLQEQHESFMGKAAHFLLGTTPQYSVDPATGKTIVTQQEQQPGQLFRSLLAGAILGGAAGAQDKTGSGLKGAAMGGAAVIENGRSVDQQNYARAQQDFKNSQEADRAQQEKLYQQAQIASMHTRDLHANAQLDLASQEHLDKLNDLNSTRELALKQAGAQPAAILVGGKNINGVQGNGSEFMGAHVNDPSVTAAPAGFERIHTQSIDYAGLKMEPGKGWVDEAGNPVDIATRTTHTFYDMPDSIYKKQINVSGAQLEATGAIPKGTLDAKKMYPTTVGDMFALTDQGSKVLHEKESTNIERQKVGLMARQVANESSRLKNANLAENRAEWTSAYQDTSQRVNLLNDQLKELKGSMNPADQASVKQIQADMRAANNDLQAVREKLFPFTKVEHPAAPVSETAAPTVKPNAAVDPVRYDAGLIQKGLTILSAMPKEDAIKAIDSAATYSDAEKLALKNKLNTPAAPAGTPMPTINASQR